MSETPTEENASKGRGAHLAVLPKGWRYQVSLVGPDEGVRIDIEATPKTACPDRHVVTVVGRDARRTALRADTLAEAAKTAVGAAKSLAKIYEKEQELAAEREALLKTLGSDSLVDNEALQALIDHEAKVNKARDVPDTTDTAPDPA